MANKVTFDRNRIYCREKMRKENGPLEIYCIVMMHMEILRPLSTNQKRMEDGQNIRSQIQKRSPDLPDIP